VSRTPRYRRGRRRRPVDHDLIVGIDLADRSDGLGRRRRDIEAEEFLDDVFAEHDLLARARDLDRDPSTPDGLGGSAVYSQIARRH
jgi:hypothetical protein